MILSKIWRSTVLCWLLAQPFAQSQNTNNPELSFPKWEYGLRGGAGFNLSHIGRPTYIRRLTSTYPLTYSYSEGGTSPHKEYYLGGFLTRNFNHRWSLRSELSIQTNANTGQAVTVGLFPRYRLTNWLSLESGLEVIHTLSPFGRNGSRAWIGAAVNMKKLEFNLRYSPSYSPSTPFNRGGWNHTIQVGMSYKLSKGRIGSSKKKV